MNSYNFLLISCLVLIPYFISLVLIKKGKFELYRQRRFWNIVLLISFLISGILGLVLAFSIDQKLSVEWYQPMLWWHVETGIVMGIVSIIHTFWHLKYFVKK